MSFYSGRFDSVDTSKVDENVKQLYRIRDNDKRNLNSQLTLTQPFFGSNDNPILPTVTKFSLMKYADPVWEQMNEEERIENGLPTKYLLLHKSPLAIIAGMLFGGLNFFNFLAYALNQYDKIFYPGGVVLRYQRKQTLFSYLAYNIILMHFSKRVPIAMYGFYFLYLLKGYNLKYHIDFYSSNEI